MTKPGMAQLVTYSRLKQHQVFPIWFLIFSESHRAEKIQQELFGLIRAFVFHVNIFQ